MFDRLAEALKTLLTTFRATSHAASSVFVRALFRRHVLGVHDQ